MAAPERYLRAAEALGADVRDVPPDHAGDLLAERVLHFMRLTDQPMDLTAFGYTEKDIPRLVEGTLVQARLLALAPIDPTPVVLAGLFRDSLGLGPPAPSLAAGADSP